MIMMRYFHTISHYSKYIFMFLSCYNKIFSHYDYTHDVNIFFRIMCSIYDW